MKSKRVTRVGGIFFKVKDPAALRAWYAKHLGMKADTWGGIAFRWREDCERPDDCSRKKAWNPAKAIVVR